MTCKGFSGLRICQQTEQTDQNKTCQAKRDEYEDSREQNEKRKGTRVNQLSLGQVGLEMQEDQQLRRKNKVHSVHKRCSPGARIGL